MVKWAIGIILGAMIAGGALAEDTIESEMAPVLKKGKSLEARDREDAVRVLLGIREGFARRLTDLIGKVNKGETDAETKAFAFSLIGEMGLVQCRDVVEPEKDWVVKPRNEEQLLWANLKGRHDADWIFGLPARFALEILDTPMDVHLVLNREAGDISKYAALNKAFLDMETRNWEDRVAAWRSIRKWYSGVCDEELTVLSPTAPEPQPDNVKITAAFILGEFRALGPDMLLWNIDLLDAEKLCSSYPAALTVETPDAAYPCAASLLKVGRRYSAHHYLTRMAVKQLSQETRNRIARTLKAVYGDDATKAYADYISRMEKTIVDGSGPVDKWKEEVHRLRTVEEIMK